MGEGKYTIKGGRRLIGTVEISGAKNSALALIPITILSRGVCVLDNVPEISDVKVCCDIMKSLGAKITYITKNKIQIDTTKVNSCRVPYRLATEMRASSYFLGALLARFHEAHVALPGGCKIGDRPIDLHLKVFQALGARELPGGGETNLYADKLVGCSVYLDFASVGATINAMLASVFAEGTTVISNAAAEPHIVDAANFLNALGARIVGAGTDTIKIHGVKELKKYVEYSVIPDQIEAGTFMCAAVATGGDVTLTNVTTKHLESITEVLRRIGAKVEESTDSIRVRAEYPLKKTNVRAVPYPGMPTDMQSQMAAVLTLADGTSVVTDDVFTKRFQYVSELRKLGANITVSDRSAIIQGVDELYAAPLEATDLRGGAAMVIACLAAKGTSTISEIHYIERGYENLVGKLKALGADIVEVTDSELESKQNA